jgi:hypothetical protein
MSYQRRNPKKWFHPLKTRGWSKSQSPETRRRNLLASTDKRKTRHDRDLEAARATGSLANVTQDPQTKMKAQSDADYFYEKARETK